MTLRSIPFCFLTMLFGYGCTHVSLVESEMIPQFYKKELQLFEDLGPARIIPRTSSNQVYWETYFKSTAVVALGIVSEYQFEEENDEGENDEGECEIKSGTDIDWIFSPRNSKTGLAVHHFMSYTIALRGGTAIPTTTLRSPPYNYNYVRSGSIRFSDRNFPEVYTVTNQPNPGIFFGSHYDRSWLIMIIDATALKNSIPSVGNTLT